MDGGSITGEDAGFQTAKTVLNQGGARLDDVTRSEPPLAQSGEVLGHGVGILSVEDCIFSKIDMDDGNLVRNIDCTEEGSGKVGTHSRAARSTRGR